MIFFCYAWPIITSSTIFFLDLGLIFPIKWFLSHHFGFAFIFPLFFVFYFRQPVAMCFITDLL